MKSLDELKITRNLVILKTAEDGGMGEIWEAGKRWASVIWSNGGGWEHVSVRPYKHDRVPTWNEMCRVKDMFFHEEEVAVQYHPKKSEYVNNLPNCLHLWRSMLEPMPTPPSILVGIRNGQTKEEIQQEISEVERKEDAERAYNAGYRKQSEGEWVVEGVYFKTMHCSICNHSVNSIYEKTPYCPNCGAKMKGGE